MIVFCLFNGVGFQMLLASSDCSGCNCRLVTVGDVGKLAVARAGLNLT